MRIRVKAEGHNINIPIPTGLIFSKPSVWLYMKLARKNYGQLARYIPEDGENSLIIRFHDLPDEAVYAICSEIMRIKRTHGRWKLVEVHSADGQEVCITL